MFLSVLGFESSALQTKEMRHATQCKEGKKNWLPGLVGSGELLTTVPIQK